MSHRKMLRYWFPLPLLLLLLLPSGKLSAQDGLYADFETSMGNFTCSLDFTNSPATVANFVSLATGERAWLDLVNGLVRTNPFYDGVTFHRVITNFVIQTGSRSGDGTDGPGYYYKDETNKLKFTTAWLLGSANSGPDSNGSQFFITVAPTSWLNGKHTIFGKVVAGTNVVGAINLVPTDANSKPYTNVYINHVTIRRVGARAQAFNTMSNSLLPLVVQVPFTMTMASSSNLFFTFTNNQFAENRLFRSYNLTDWYDERLGIELGASPTNRFDRTNALNHCFYRLARVQYPGSTLAPAGMRGRTSTMSLAGLGTLKLEFDNQGKGTYTYSSKKGPILDYTYVQDAYRGYFDWISYSNLPPMVLTYYFDTATKGSIDGYGYNGLTPFSITGTFTLSP